MHHLYETEAYVLKTIPSGEADMIIVLCTESLGLIRAIAQGVRYEKSKLRFAVQEYARVTVSLVQGKGMWRLTNAQTGVLLASTATSNSRKVIARIFKLLERLLTGEQIDTALFRVLDDGLVFLQSCDDEVSQTSVERLLVLRLLYQLGYIDDSISVVSQALAMPWGQEMLQFGDLHKTEIIKQINNGIRESQL